MTRSTICILLAGIWGSTAVAQQVRPCAATTDSIARACELDAWPGARTRREPPRYPDIMRAAGVEGHARVEFVVDSSGRPILSTLRIRASHDLFATMVRNALPRSRFEPPRRKGLAVSVMVIEEVEFSHPGNNVYLTSGRSPSSFGVDSTGVLRTRVAAYVPFDSAAAPRLSDDERWTIYYEVADHLIREEQRRPSGFCVQVNREQPPAAFFARWTAASKVVVPFSRCPRTYNNWIVPPDTARAPPGWVDPVMIDMDTLKPWALDRVILEVRYSRGSATQHHQCEVVRDSDGWKQVGCIVIRISMG